MELPILSQETFDNPTKFEYFIRFILLADENNISYELKIKTKNSALVDYCGKVSTGETLDEAVRRELFNYFSINDIESKFIYKQESALNRYGENLPRVVLVVTVDKNQVKTNDGEIIWSEIKTPESIKNDINIPKDGTLFVNSNQTKTINDSGNNVTEQDTKFSEILANLEDDLEYGYLAENSNGFRMDALEFVKLGGMFAGNRFITVEDAEKFLKNLLDLGAEKVDAVAINIYEDEKVAGTASLEVFLPDDPNKRSAVIKICNEEIINEGFEVEKDNGEKSIYLWWD